MPPAHDFATPSVSASALRGVRAPTGFPSLLDSACHTATLVAGIYRRWVRHTVEMAHACKPGLLAKCWPGRSGKAGQPGPLPWESEALGLQAGGRGERRGYRDRLSPGGVSTGGSQVLAQTSPGPSALWVPGMF